MFRTSYLQAIEGLVQVLTGAEFPPPDHGHEARDSEENGVVEGWVQAGLNCQPEGTAGAADEQDHGQKVVLHSGPLQLGPDLAELVREQVLAADSALAVALDQDGQLGAWSPGTVGAIEEVRDGGVALPGENLAFRLFQREKVGLEFHASSTPHGCLNVNTFRLSHDGVLKTMTKSNDDTLIRLDNLKALGLTPQELTAKVGSSKQYWSDMLRGRKSFGERIARKIEEKLELPRSSLDQPSVNESHAAGERDKVACENLTAEQNASSSKTSPTEIPTKMQYEPRHLRNAILLMGNLLGALDVRSKKYVGDMLQELALKSDDPDEIEDIANKASSVANVQKPVTKNAQLNKSLIGRGDAVETVRSSLEQ